jgi:hypothetical protein
VLEEMQADEEEGLGLLILQQQLLKQFLKQEQVLDHL